MSIDRLTSVSKGWRHREGGFRFKDIEPAFGRVEKSVGEAALASGLSSATIACGAARLDLRTAIVGVVRGDLFGHFMLARSLRPAAICGSLSTRAQGGTAAQATLAEALPYSDADGGAA